jgi:chemotaxis protein methyltransferase CheR
LVQTKNTVRNSAGSGVIDKRTFDKFRELIYRESGISLKENKNVTHFFREERHFEVLANLARQWEAEGRRDLRLWCAASSTGEEPYSLAMTLLEATSYPGEIKIIASDISTQVLKKAQRGIYQARQVEKIPRLYLARYFQKGRGRADGLYRVKPVLREMVIFRRINLSTPPYPVRGPLDIVFCRNVMIYFDNKLRKQLLENMYSMLRTGGYMMVGHAESLSGMLSSFKSVEPSVYIKAPSGGKQPRLHK